MGLHVCIISTEQLFCPGDSQFLDIVYELTAPVVAFVRITLCVFIGQD